MDTKNEVLYRVYILLFGMVVPFAGWLMYKTIDISIITGEKWRAMGENNYIAEREIEAERGNIMAADGSLLATSVPIFDLYFDPFTPSEEDFTAHVDSLAYCLATYVDNTWTVGGYKDYLLELRDSTKNTNRHVLIKKQVSYAEKKRIEEFPLFNLGQFRGGMITEKRSERKRPFGLLARRTIGYVRESSHPIGLEGYYDEVLGGRPGKQMMLRVDKRRDIWMPLEDLTSIEPQSGDDILTTIDINLQDITEQTLLRALQNHDADWGTAIVMEVETGAIRSIANIGRGSDGWYESYNHAIASAVEPGSTFKLATMMALLEDGFVDLSDSIDIERGRTEFYDEVMEDATAFSFGIDSTSVGRIFEISSNVGMAKLVEKYYGKKEKINKNLGAARFIDRLKQFNLHLPTGIALEGEANPYVKEAYNEADQWSGTTLPWMSIGYELKITPLQLLSFYNAVANDGKLMKPLLVSEIRRFGETIETFKPTVVKRKIASEKTIEQVQGLLKGVVKEGTAYKLKTDEYDFAGKTGTAQINYTRSSTGTRIGGYQASFVGYFPADQPKYSCIIVIRRPRQHGFYGGDVAGPVFREIADQCFNSLIELHDPMNIGPKPALAARRMPSNDIGEKEDFNTILTYLDIPHFGDPGTAMAVLEVQNDSLVLQRRTLPEGAVPNVVGMGLRDALFALENRNLSVQLSGVGKVVQQSILPGTRARGQTVYLTLR